MKKVLITGGAGFIGSHLSEYYLKNNYKVLVIDDLSTGRIENIKHLENNKDFEFIIGDVTDEEIIKKNVQGIDTIIHLAAAVGVKYIIENPIKSILTNVKGTENVLKVANSKKIPVFIASTSEVYGKNVNVPLSEDDDRISGSTDISRWNYSCSKSLDEFLSLAYFNEKKLPVVVGRFFNTCGPRQIGDYGMVIPKFVKQALLDIPITIYGDGKQVRCFTHVYDVVKAVYDLMQNKECYGKVFNIGSDIPVTISKLADIVIKKTNSNSDIEYVPYNKIYGKNFEDMMIRQPNLSRIKSFIDFKTNYKIENIIDDVIKYFED